MFRKNVANKSILILGSGPSARDVDWKKENYDSIITTSFFYLNEPLLDLPICHISLSKRVDLQNNDLLKFLRKNINCTISFEPKIAKFIENNTIPSENKIINRVINTHKFYQDQSFISFYKEFGNRLFFYRAQGGLEGLAGRIFWPLIELSPSKIYFCGLDGVSKTPNMDPKNYFRDHHGTTEKHYTYERYKASFESYAEKMYTKAKQKNIHVVNLGKNKDYNLMTRISEKYE